MKRFKNLHFIGIGGSGMSALAQLLSHQGNLTGSDRSFSPKTPTQDLFKKLQSQQIQLFPQNGEGINSQTSRVVYSTAIEKDNPDLIQAQKFGKPLIHRSELLAEIISNKELIAISGTSGKSTICGMIGVILHHLQLSPTIINGGEILNFISENQLGNTKKGDSSLVVIEADESDKTLKNYFPKISILSNISKDHCPTEELIPLFEQFSHQTKETLILNQDCPYTRKLNNSSLRSLSYGIHHQADFQAKQIELSLSGSSFTVQGIAFKLQVPGEHNISNALAAISASISLGLKLPQIAKALETFQGIKRRLERIPSSSSIHIYDDFAHNPDKIRSSFQTISPYSKKVIAIFQPHGYYPTRFLFNEYVETFSQELRETDQLYLLPIFDAGGTAKRDISSEDLARAIPKKVKAIPSKEDLLKELSLTLTAGDTVLVMGARDPSLTDLCHTLAKISLKFRVI